jgi:hypothetical protein
LDFAIMSMNMVQDDSFMVMVQRQMRVGLARSGWGETSTSKREEKR